MSLASQVSQQFREIYFGKWIANTNLKQELTNTTWRQATTKIGDLNTIADLTFHINYYVAGLINVLEGGTLDIKDKYSFDYPPIESDADWQQLLDKSWKDAERFTDLIAQTADEKLFAPFVKEQYGNYYKNIQAIIDHCYYHFGQVVLIRKMLEKID